MLFFQKMVGLQNKYFHTLTVHYSFRLSEENQPFNPTLSLLLGINS